MVVQDQLWIDEGERHLLFDQTFVIVDLETTGGKPSDAQITEIGAVKVRGGEILGTFATLVNPEVAIPAYITVLTGITDASVISAPTVPSAITELISWAQWDQNFSADLSDHGINQPIFVAHNAPYDLGFIKGAVAKHQLSWRVPKVLDTADLARRVLPRGEVPNRKLATLARHFHAATTPTHRALDDALATVDVLHGLIARLGNLGIDSVEELKTFRNRDVEKRSRKKYLANGLPNSPGVYVFEDAQGRSLYIGKSKNIKSRAASYFTGAENRNRMNQMIALATNIRAIPCTSELEASIRELRLIDQNTPSFNVAAKRPAKVAWIELTCEHTPRLRIRTSKYLANQNTIGPFPNIATAQLAALALYEVTNIRQCTKPIGPRTSFTPCILQEIGKCPAPCVSPDGITLHQRSVAHIQNIFSGQDTTWVSQIKELIHKAAQEQNYELAAIWRDRAQALLQGLHQNHQIRALATIEELIAAKRSSHGGWELHLIRSGQLAGAALVPAGLDPKPTIEALKISGATYSPDTFLPSEARLIINWLSEARLVETSRTWKLPTSANPKLLSSSQLL